MAMIWWNAKALSRLDHKRLQAEAELQRAKELAEAGNQVKGAFLATVQEAFIAIDESSRICEWNRQAELTFGWTQQEAMGRLLTETIIPPRYRDAHRQGVDTFLATGAGPVLNQRLELAA